jgi:hypothetical protein
MGLLDNIIGAESGGSATAANPNSSALGPSQFISSTWLDMMHRYRPDIQGSDDQLLAMRTDPQLSREMTANYAAENQRTLSQAGLPVTPGSTYLAHFAGPQGAVKVLQADPNAPVSSILGDAAVRANPFLRGMTAAGLQAWADRKMGGSTAPAQQAQAAPAPQGPAPTQPSPASGLMQLAGTPPAQQGQAAPAPSYWAQQAAMPTPPPIFYAPRRAPDLRALQAALGSGGFFKRT